MKTRLPLLEVRAILIQSGTARSCDGSVLPGITDISGCTECSGFVILELKNLVVLIQAAYKKVKFIVNFSKIAVYSTNR